MVASGLCHSDDHLATGDLPAGTYPMAGGHEGAGVVDKVGPDVENIEVGDRVAYAGPIGGYSEERLIAADRLVKLPEGISFDEAAKIVGAAYARQVREASIRDRKSVV